MRGRLLINTSIESVNMQHMTIKQLTLLDWVNAKEQLHFKNAQTAESVTIIK